MATATLTKSRKPRAAKPVKQLIIVGREVDGSTTNYYIQSGDMNVYESKIENGVATACNRLTGEACESFLYSPRGRKGCKHTACAEQNEATRATDQQQHVQDDLHSCYSCGYRVKHAGLCHKCA